MLEDTTMPRSTIGLLITLVFSLLLAPLAAEAQRPGKVPLIGILALGAPPFYGLDEVQQGLRDLGYVEGENIAFEVRWAAFRFEHLPALAAELVRLGVDVIVTHGPPGVKAAMAATRTIPIVMARIDDAEEHGLVASLARPGGNVTGLSIQTGELSDKWLDLLREVLPSLSRVAILWDATGTVNQLRTLEQAAHAVGVQLHVLEVRSVDDFPRAFAAATTAHAEGLVILGSPLMTENAAHLAELAAQHRLPATYTNRRFVEAGGLLTYGPKEPDPSWGWRRAAVFVDKILKGTKPADLPVERPTTFELIINVKTAEALGLTIPPTLLCQADEVIR
jgi:putative ABC transport system substrate-binding protein